MPLTESFRNQILNHLFGKQEFIPVTFQIALLLSGDLAQGFREPQDSHYQRRIITADQWSNKIPGQISNYNDIIFHEFLRDTFVIGIGLYGHPDTGGLYALKVSYPPVLYESGSHVIIYSGDLVLKIS